MAAITLFVSDLCGPCQEVKDIVAKGLVKDEIRLVDISTDEGFREFFDAVLADGDGVVPSAYKDGQRCAILIDTEDQSLEFSCPGQIVPDEEVIAASDAAAAAAPPTETISDHED